MRDIEMAEELLEKENLALVIVKDGNVVFSSSDRGIKPLYMAVNELKDELGGSSVADRVTGKAAAMLCVYAGVKELSTRLISENAIRVFEKTPIVFKHRESVPYIKNRDKTGMCPVETLSSGTDDINELLKGIAEFLVKISIT